MLGVRSGRDEDMNKEETIASGIQSKVPFQNLWHENLLAIMTPPLSVVQFSSSGNRW
jgi:hypothetical protein